MEDKYKKIISYYGVQHQVRKFSEESFELIEAITKFEEAKLNHFENYDENDKKQAYKNIVEEVGDVLVMVNQFIEHYKIQRTAIYMSMEQKVDRQLERIKWEDEGV